MANRDQQIHTVVTIGLTKPDILLRLCEKCHTKLTETARTRHSLLNPTAKHDSHRCLPHHIIINARFRRRCGCVFSLKQMKILYRRGVSRRKIDRSLVERKSVSRVYGSIDWSTVSNTLPGPTMWKKKRKMKNTRQLGHKIDKEKDIRNGKGKI